MGEIQELKLILREETSHLYTDEEIAYYLNKNNGNINNAAYECLLLKAEDDSIQLPGGLTLANNSEYWLRLAKKYKPNGSRIL